MDQRSQISIFSRKFKIHRFHDILVDRIAWLWICPINRDLVIPKRYFSRYKLASGHRGRAMILELDKDETTIEAAIVRARIQVNVDDAVQNLGQLLHELRLGLGLRHTAEEEPTVVHGFNHANTVAGTDFVAVQKYACLPSDSRFLIKRERVTARRPGEVQHQPQLQQSANPFQYWHQLVLVTVTRQSAQEHLRTLNALLFTACHFRCH